MYKICFCNNVKVFTVKVSTLLFKLFNESLLNNYNFLKKKLLKSFQLYCISTEYIQLS